LLSKDEARRIAVDIAKLPELAFLGIWINILSCLDQREVLGVQLFLQFIHFLDQRLSFLAVFLLISLANLVTERENASR